MPLLLRYESCDIRDGDEEVAGIGGWRDEDIDQA